MASESVILKAVPREGHGKEPAKKMRREGKLPAVVYGAGGQAVSVTLDEHDFSLVRARTHGDQVLIKLQVGENQDDNVFIKDIQLDPVTDRPVHADLLRVDMTKKIRLAVPVTVEGGAPIGVREGGLLERLREEVTVEALPDRVPAHIAIDLSDLEIHHSFHVSDLPAFDGVEYLDDPETALYTVVVKTHVEEEVKPEAEEGEEGEEMAAEGAEEASDESSEES